MIRAHSLMLRGLLGAALRAPELEKTLGGLEELREAAEDLARASEGPRILEGHEGMTFKLMVHRHATVQARLLRELEASLLAARSKSEA